MKDRYYLTPEIGVALLAIVLGGFFRLYHLGSNSLGSDEAIVYWSSTVFLQPLKSILLKHLYHPLFMYYVYNIFRWEETPEWLFRFIPAFIGILTIWMEYKIGSLLLGAEGGAISALILSLSPFHIFLSQNYPLYSPMIFFILGSMYYFTLFVLGDTRLRCCLFYVLFTCISFNIHYMTILFILLQNLLVLYLLILNQFDRISLKQWIISQAILGVFLLPTLFPFLYTILHASKETKITFLIIPNRWGELPRLQHLFYGYLITIFSPSLVYGPISGGYYRWNILLVVILFFIFLAIVGLVKSLNKSRNASLKKLVLLGYLFVPQLLLYIVSHWKMLIQIQYVAIMLMCPYAMIMARGIISFQRMISRFFLTLILTFLLIYFSFQQSILGTIEDFRSPSEYIARAYRPGDVVGFHITWFQPAFTYYLKGRPIPLFSFYTFIMPEGGVEKIKSIYRKQIYDLSLHYRRLWLTSYYNTTFYNRYLLKEELDKEFPVIDSSDPSWKFPGFVLYDLKAKKIPR